MADSFDCNCEERRKPVKERAWVVRKRYCHYSAFGGYRRTPSQYSTVSCLKCGAIGRTKAKYVQFLRDAEPGE